MSDPTADVRRQGLDGRKHRRGVYLLPSLCTIGNMFCGYACIVYAMRGELETAAPFVGIAFILDALDGRIARMTGTASAFGVELDSLADVISFGLAPSVLAFAWGLSELGRLGWAAGFIYVSAAALRLARFNIQTGTQVDKRYFIGMPTPPAAGVVAATVYAWPYSVAVYGTAQSIVAAAVMLVPAVLMVSTLKFRSFKTIEFGWRRSYVSLWVFVLIIAFITVQPRYTLALLAYSYLLSAFVEWGVTRWRLRRDPAAAPPAA